MTGPHADASSIAAASLSDRTACALLADLKAGDLSATALVEACLARIAALEPTIHAWAHLDAEHARRQAMQADRSRAEGATLGPLHGLPVGVKDIIDTKDFPTEFGTPLHRGRRSAEDASLVRNLREAGAIILGKTVTTEMAVYSPGPTRNPRDPSRTPGGSSSGSAAAVACGMVPLGVGTQTNGSVIRPAAYCGVVGYKPSFGLISGSGILRQAELLDHVGGMARSVGDVALLADVLAGVPRSRDDAGSRLFAASSEPAARPKLAFVRGPFWPRADEEARTALEALVGTIGEVVRIELPPVFAEGAEAHRVIMEAGIARAFRSEYERGREGLSDLLRSMIERGAAIDPATLGRAEALRARLIESAADKLAPFDAALTLATSGPAPPFSEGTGSPIFATIWTLVGAPAMTLPLLAAANGLPIGVQLVGTPGSDAPLLRAAAWLEARFA
jgi:Asp-tRNA(Asn)/Glu-tRNA(Gln) amidotransferase A subunit family amidase